MATVEVILTKNERGIGKFGQRKKVKLGFFANYLLPHGMAILATKGNQERFKTLEKEELNRLKEVRQKAEELKASLEGKAITIQAATQENGKLYGSVTPTQIAQRIHQELKIDVEARLLEIQSPIKQIGETEVNIDLHPEVAIAITVNVIPEIKEVAPVAR